MTNDPAQQEPLFIWEQLERGHCTGRPRRMGRMAVPTEAPTILVANRHRPVATNLPVGYGASLQLIIHNITPFGQWPAPLGNGLLGWATGQPVGEHPGLENAPCARAAGGLPGCPHGCYPWTKSPVGE
jgi:hypothetical protein